MGVKGRCRVGLWTLSVLRLIGWRVGWMSGWSGGGEGLERKGPRTVVGMYGVSFLCACVVEMRSGLIPGNGLAGPSGSIVSS